MSLNFIIEGHIINTKDKVLYFDINDSSVGSFHNEKYQKDNSAFMASLDLLHKKKSAKHSSKSKLPAIISINKILLNHLDHENSVVLNVGGSVSQQRTGDTYI